MHKRKKILSLHPCLWFLIHFYNSQPSIVLLKGTENRICGNFTSWRPTGEGYIISLCPSYVYIHFTISVNEIEENGLLLCRHMNGAVCDGSTQTCRTQLTGDEGWKQTVTQLPEPVSFWQQGIMLGMGGSLATRAISITVSVQTTHIHSTLSADNKNILLQHKDTHAEIYFLKNMCLSIC
jgi:hypothetical protein